MPKIIKNRIKKTGLYEWEKVKDLQPPDIKIEYNLDTIVSLIKKHGVAKTREVWEDPKTGEVYWVDGHTMKKALKQLKKKGYKIPKKLHVSYVNAKDREEAIRMLIEVHNLKQNPMNSDTLFRWLETEEIDAEDVEVEVISTELPESTITEAELAKFFEKDKTEKGEVFYRFTLKFSEEQFEEIKETLKDFDGTKEEFFYTLIVNSK